MKTLIKQTIDQYNSKLSVGKSVDKLTVSSHNSHHFLVFRQNFYLDVTLCWFMRLPGKYYLVE